MTHPLGAAVAFAVAIPTTLYFDGMPPARYQGDTGVLHVRYVTEPNSPGACGISSRGRFAACVRGDTMILPNPCPVGDTQRFAELTCHELGHVNGWPAEHGA